MFPRAGFFSCALVRRNARQAGEWPGAVRSAVAHSEIPVVVFHAGLPVRPETLNWLTELGLCGPEVFRERKRWAMAAPISLYQSRKRPAPLPPLSLPSVNHLR